MKTGPCPVADVCLGGACAGHAAQGVVERVVLVVALGLVAGQQRVTVLVNERAVLVQAARADDAGQRGQGKAEVALHAQRGLLVGQL